MTALASQRAVRSFLCYSSQRLPVNTAANQRRGVTSQQLVMHNYGEPADAVTMETREVPSLVEGEVLVRMLAAPIHPADINTIQGTYGVRPDLPCVLGNEGVAEVLESRTPQLLPGQWVVPRTAGLGTWRSHAVTTPAQLTAVSSALPLALAATLVTNPGTACRMLRDYVKLKHGDTVLQNGANSAVGRAVIQLCAAWGLRSVNVIRDRPDVATLRDELTALGADVVLTEEELRAARGDANTTAALALNCVSGRSATELLRCVAPGGTMVTYGGMARKPVTVAVGSLIFGDVTLRGHWQTRWSQDVNNTETRRLMLEELTTLGLEGRLEAPPHDLVPFGEWPGALTRAMPSGGGVGRKQILCFD